MGICTAGPKAFFGSKAEIRVHSPDVSLKPESRHSALSRTETT